MCGVCLYILLTFSSLCQWESGVTEYQTIQNSVLVFHSQEAYWKPGSHFCSFLLCAHCVVGVTNNREIVERWAAGKP